MALNEDQPRLGCGRLIDEVWASIDEPPSTHEQTCADCQSARAALHHLVAVTESMRDRDRDNPALQPGKRVKEAIMMVARAEVRRSRRTPLATTSLGTIDISEQALSALIRFAASTLPGVRARRCTVTAPRTIQAPQAGQATQAGASATTMIDVEDVRITLTVALSSQVRIPVTMELLRERVGTIVQAQTSITMQQIDILVEDLYDL